MARKDHVRRLVTRWRVRRLRQLNAVLEWFITRGIIPVAAKRVARSLESQGVAGLTDVRFFPYHTPACRLQHRALAAVVGHLGIRTTVYGSKPKVALSERDRSEFPLLGRGDITLSSFSELLDTLEAHVGHDPVVSRGVIDEFVKKCSLDVFRGDYRIPGEYLEKVAVDVVSARTLVRGASAIVLAETSYVMNRALVAAARDHEIPAWVLNPDGHWLRAHQTQDENFYPLSVADVQRAMEEDPGLLPRARDYVAQRFAGQSFTDLDSSKAFAGSDQVPEHLQGKKILCLHAFRDASQLPMENEVPWRRALFRTYFEWADFVFGEIAHNPDQWAIRPHPSSAFYHGDAETLDYLLAKHGLSDIARATGVSTGALLRHRSPIYTHSGTIAVETAIFGYQSHTCSTLYPDELVEYAQSLEGLREALHRDVSQSTHPVTDPLLVDAATVILYRRMNPRFSGFSPTPGQPNRNSPLLYEKSILKQQRSLAGLIAKRKVDVGVRRAANQLRVSPDEV